VHATGGDAPPLQYWPAVHAAPALLEPPAPQNRPAETLQSSAGAAPPVQYEPAGQLTHPADEAVPAAQYCPAIQPHATGLAAPPAQ
jgi:hypothetical protein